MLTNFDPVIFPFSLSQEGGFVDNPHDPGGATNMGITLATLRDWRKDEDLTTADVAALTVADVRPIYLTRFWRPINGSLLMSGIDLSLFDAAINTGDSVAAKQLQRLLNVTVDGDIGPMTIRALGMTNPNKIIEGLAVAQELHYRSLADFPAFGTGWLRRVAARKAAALSLAAKGP